MDTFNQGDTVCVDRHGIREAGNAAGASSAVRWREGMIMAVMPEGEYRVGFYGQSDECVVTAEQLRPRADGETCDGVTSDE